MLPKDSRLLNDADFLAAGFAAVVGHELNNITVPLRGFLDLIGENVHSSRPIDSYLKELQVGIERLMALSTALENLADLESNVERVIVAECLPSTVAGRSFVVDLTCSAQIAVEADPLHAQRALSALLQLAVPTAPASSPVTLTIAEESWGRRGCAVCDDIPPTEDRFLVFTTSVRAATIAAIREPFAQHRSSRTAERLALAICGRCAHLAGGHVLNDRDAGTIGVALPCRG